MRIFESSQIMRRIVRLANEPVTSPKPTGTPNLLVEAHTDAFVGPAPKAAQADSPPQQTSNLSLIRTLWTYRKEPLFSQTFIVQTSALIQECISTITEMPDQYVLENRLKVGTHKKEAIAAILNTLTENLEALREKTLGSIAWSLLWKTTDIDSLLTEIVSPFVRLLAEMATEDIKRPSSQKAPEENAVRALVELLKAVPHAVLSQQELEAKSMPSLLEAESQEEKLNYYYCQNLQAKISTLEKALLKLGLTQKNIEKIINVIRHPDQAHHVLIPQAVSSLGRGVDDPYHQVLGGHLLRLATRLAPICAPKKDNLFCFLSKQSDDCLEQIAINSPSLQRYLQFLRSEYKMQKTKEDLKEWQRFAPPIYKALQKTSLGLKLQKTHLRALQKAHESPENKFSESCRQLLNREKEIYPLYTYYSQMILHFLGIETPLSKLEQAIERLNNHTIDFIHFYNLMETIPKDADWVYDLGLKFKKTLAKNDGDINTFSLRSKSLGNKTIQADLKDQLQREIRRYQTQLDRFNDSLWTNRKVKIQRIQKWVQPFISHCRFEIHSVMRNIDTPVESTQLSITNIHGLRRKLQQRHTILLELFQLIQTIKPENELQTHLNVAATVGIPYSQLASKFRKVENPEAFQKRAIRT